MASTCDLAVNIVMLTNTTFNKTYNIHDSVKKLFMQLAVRFYCKYCHGNKCVILIKHFGIHDLLKNYSCYNVFNRENMNTFNVLTFI